jgi:hypothetical protein
VRTCIASRRDVFTSSEFLLLDISTNWIDGIWTGIGFQQQGFVGTVWTIKFTADENKSEFFIEYPTLGSSGVWKLMNKESMAERYSFEEVILNQRGNTMDGGKVVVTKVNDDYMSFSYFLPPLCETVVAWSTLKRE